MSIEKRWGAIPAVSFLLDGTIDGLVTLDTPVDLHTKQIIFLTSNTQPTKQLQVKRVLSKTQILVGLLTTKINVYENVSAYTILDSAALFALEQPRPDIPAIEHERAVYEEEPVVAKRMILVDDTGEKFNSTNRFPVEAVITVPPVQVDIEAFSPTPDSILAVGTEDGTKTGTKHVLKVNPDGSLAISLTQVSGIVKSVFNEITLVASGLTETILTYTVPVAKNNYLLKVEASGTNIATYNLSINSVIYARKRTYFGGPLNVVFDLGSSLSDAPKFVAGDIIKIEVDNFRPDTGDFEARFQLIEL